MRDGEAKLVGVGGGGRGGALMVAGPAHAADDHPCLAPYDEPGRAPITVRLAVHKRAGRKRPKVIKVVFFVKHGSKRVDRRAPYRRAVLVKLAPGTKGRVYARVHYRRPGDRRVHTRTVSRPFQICGS